MSSMMIFHTLWFAGTTAALLREPLATRRDVLVGAAALGGAPAAVVAAATKPAALKLPAIDAKGEVEGPPPGDSPPAAMEIM